VVISPARGGGTTLVGTFNTANTVTQRLASLLGQQD
jgi:2-phospho-L-lactate guanylyltransferase (CobY/MobA/RfbA family)